MTLLFVFAGNCGLLLGSHTSACEVGLEHFKHNRLGACLF